MDILYSIWNFGNSQIWSFCNLCAGVGKPRDVTKLAKNLRTCLSVISSFLYSAPKQFQRRLRVVFKFEGIWLGLFLCNSWRLVFFKEFKFIPKITNKLSVKKHFPNIVRAQKVHFVPLNCITRANLQTLNYLQQIKLEVSYFNQNYLFFYNLILTIVQNSFYSYQISTNLSAKLKFIMFYCTMKFVKKSCSEFQFLILVFLSSSMKTTEYIFGSSIAARDKSSPSR